MHAKDMQRKVTQGLRECKPYTQSAWADRNFRPTPYAKSLADRNVRPTRCDDYFMLSRIEPTMPPTTPPSTVCRLTSRGMYFSMAWASLAMGRVCSQMRPGPVSEARKMPSPPKIIFLIPGTVVIWKETLD